jgi:hypothetical protein
MGRPRSTGAGSLGLLAVVLSSVLSSAFVVGVAVPSTADAASSVTCTPVTGTPATPAPLASYTAITPQRLVDTRDGTGGVSQPVGAGCTLIVDLVDAPIAAEARAVALSVTSIAAERGFLTVFACEHGQPPTSNVNNRPGVPTPNLVVATVGSDDRVCVYASAATDLVIDVAGWWGAGPDRFASIPPVRAYDTRELPGGAVLPAGEVRPIALAGGVLPAGATSAVVNLTVDAPLADGWLVAFPCGTEPPLASNLNYLASESRAVAAIVGLSGDGEMCVLSSADTHVIVDVAGYYAPAPQFGPAAELRTLTGFRVADTRDAPLPWTTPFAAGETRRVDPLAGTGLAGQAAAVVLNVVSTEATAPGFVTIWPCGADRPLVSSLNYAAGGESTNLVTVELSPGGEVCLYSLAATDLVVDLFGVLTPPTGSLAERLAFTGRHTFPPFTPEGSDYAVACETGETAATLDADVLSGVSVRVNGLVTPAGKLDLVIPADGLTTVELTRGATRSRYFFRCVPPDFPRLDVQRPGNPAPGWYLTSFGMGNTTSGSFVAILDERGAPVWFKRTDRDVIDVKRLSNSRLAYTPLLGQGFGIDPDSGYREITLTGTLVAERLTDDPAALPVDHHDMVELPNGGRALLSYPLVRDQDLTALGSNYFDDESIVDGVIQEVSAGGSAIWTWSTRDHFGYDEATFPQRFALYPSEPHGGEVDPWHLNSLDRVADGSGDYVVSARHLDAIFRVDRATGGVDWILGGATSVARPERLTIVGDPLGGPRRPHDARLVGDVLTLFDNRAGMTGEAARAVAYRIDPVARTATLLWQIAEPQGRNSFGLGSVRVAGDGSVLVGWGALQPMFAEYTADRELLMSIAHEPSHQSYRIVKYPKDTFSAAVLRLTAGGIAEAP